MTFSSRRRDSLLFPSLVCLFVLSSPPARSAAGAAAQQPTAAELTQKALQAASAGQRDEALRLLLEAETLANAVDDAVALGHALRARAGIVSLAGDAAAAGQLFDRAQAAFERVSASNDLGVVLDQRGSDAYRRGALGEAEYSWLGALAAFRQTTNIRGQANALRNLSFLSHIPIPDRLLLLDEAWALQAPLGEPRMGGLIRVNQGDLIVTLGDYAGGLPYLEQAVELLGADNPRSPQYARALTSLARANRLLWNLDRALTLNQRASAIIEATADLDGAAQSIQATSMVHLEMGHAAEAFAAADRALEMARRSGRAFRVDEMIAHKAVLAARLKPPDEALADIDTLAAEQSTTAVARAILLMARAHTLLTQERGREALTTIDDAIDRLGPNETAYRRANALYYRALALESVGQLDAAEAAIVECVNLTEGIRAGLADADRSRTLFAETRQVYFRAHVRVLAKTNRMQAALAASERARARAFVDLLASRREPSVLPRALPPTRQPVLSRVASGPLAVTSLVSAIRAAAPPAARPFERLLESRFADIASTLADSVKTAATRGTHLLTYWVEDRDTWIWVVSPNGGVMSAHVPVEKARLAALVRATWSSSSLSTRSPDAPDSSDGGIAAPAWEPVLRGNNLGRVTFDPAGPQAFRELDRLLIAPIRAALPKQADALVTIIPHGPLFRLSFAPLQAPDGRYLLERARIAYAPSVTALAQLTGGAAPAAVEAMVVADPELPGGLARRERLARLSGAAVEGRAVARSLGDKTTLLVGSEATEARLRRGLGSQRVLHLATHGVIRDVDPLTSFLALGGSGTSSEDDGRLTTAEVYDLKLQAALVVLSACRSAVGPVTGDGLIGMTRAFFAAGARSVIASLWDLPDLATAPVLSRFYQEWQKTGSKAEALRRAQLAFIRDLRAGRVRIDTRLGPLTIPEHPSLWAGLVLVGEP
jgi:CHAT domain-containing protein/tetratricopeptide (TPR) repeat protein